MFLTTGVLVAQWKLDHVVPLLYLFSLLLAGSVAVMAHNHNHLPMWKARWLNVLTDYWITLFYGYPAFAWIPTHNQNHHHFINKEGDYTKTWRYTEGNNLATLMSYPSISSYHQHKPIAAYLREIRQRRPVVFWLSIGQYLVLAVFLIGALLVDWQKAVLFVIIPQQFGLFSVLVFNYLQHVHAEEESEWNHSRNFVGKWFNLFYFNNGFHTVHHKRAAMHWSLAPKSHAEIAHHIDPDLNESNVIWYLVRTYLLAPFFPRFRGRNMRLERMARDQCRRSNAKGVLLER
ncbi:MAG: fatty acid desaturase [Verrucomicrobiae bacterium]|nr:fatty acid desaturase [Verrucomicrobiae bacterium]